jgi:hypothetical protein
MRLRGAAVFDRSCWGGVWVGGVIRYQTRVYALSQGGTVAAVADNAMSARLVAPAGEGVAREGKGSPPGGIVTFGGVDIGACRFAHKVTILAHKMATPPTCDDENDSHKIHCQFDHNLIRIRP